MVLEQKSNQPNVHDFFENPIKNQSAINTLIREHLHDDLSQDISLNKYLNEKAISEMINVNSEITKIFNKLKISIKINMKILDNLVKNHLPQTRKIALGIANNLPQNFQQAINRNALIKATSLHDLAKVIMPEDIINKNGALSPEEKAIMEKHSELSYEMLKSTDLDPQTLNLIKNHHQNSAGSGYPAVEKDFIADINLQILSMADIYSALREKRSYKAEMSKEKALSILEKETKAGKFHPMLFKALVSYANKDEGLIKLNSKRKLFDLEFINGFSA